MAPKRIPVGKDGRVPAKALAARYQEIGRRSDSGSRSAKVIRRNPTPDEVRQWWDDPSSYDIEGIDTPYAPIYSVPGTIRGRKRKALARIAVVSPRKEADRIRRIMAQHFTADELELLAEGRSMVISTVPRLDDCTGYYVRAQKGVPVPEIVLEEGTTADGIVHELVHALRAKDGRTAFPTQGGELSSSYQSMPSKRRSAIQSREEKETVLETVARTVPDRCESGYYSRIPGEDPRKAYLKDQKTVSGSKALKGRAAIEAAERSYDRSTISRAVISGNAKRRRR